MINYYNSLSHRFSSVLSSQEPDVVGNAPNSGRLRNSWLMSLVLMALLLSGLSSSAQCIIGTGIGVTTTTTGCPTERYYNYEHYQIVYTATELSAGGMSAGSTISALGFSISTSPVSLANFTISIGHTAQTSASPYIPVAGLTVVKPAFTYAPLVQTAGNFDMITLTTPFIWNGTSNIVVNTCTGSNPFTSPYGAVRFTTGATVTYNRLDGSSNCATATATTTTNRPNIRFNFSAGTPCTGTPVAGTVSPAVQTICASGTTSAFTASGYSTGTGITFQWQQSADGSTAWVTAVGGSGATTNSYTPPNTTALYYRMSITCSGSTTFSSAVQLLLTNCDFNVTRTTGITYNTIGTSGIGLTGFTSFDDSSSNATNIGFNFFYKGTTYTQFVANTNGFLGLGSSTSSSYTNGLATGTNLIAPYWDDLFVTGGGALTNISNFIKYQLNGVAPNRVLTVEWIGMEQYANAGPNINFQVKLYETTNQIEIVHGQMQVFDGSTGTGSPYSYSLGLAGPSTATGTNRTLSQLGENSNVFTVTDPTTLAVAPECNVSYMFSGAAAYTGPSTFAYSIPANDNVAGAIAVPVNASPCQNLCGTYFNSNLATASPQTSSCTTAPDDDVWFKFVAPTSGQVLVSVKSASGNDAVVALTNASFVELSTFGCVNAVGNALTENLNPTGLTPGATYYVRVSNNGVGSGSRSGFSICVSDSFIPPPVNDNPCGAVVLTPATSCVPFSDTTHGISGSTNLSGATTTTSNGVVTPTLTGVGTNVTDVWFKFTATSDYHGITVTPVPGFDVAIQAYSVSAGTTCPTTLSLVSSGAVNGAGSGSVENVQFATIVGADYYLRVFRYPSGIAGAPVNDSQFSICVFNPTPVCVVNTAPANLATAVSSNPILTWPSTSFASSYDVYLGTTSGPTTLLTNVANVNGNISYSYTLTPAQTLNELTTYYWYVTPKNLVGSASCGAANQTSFTTAAIPIVLTSATPTSVCLGGNGAARTIVVTGSGFTGTTLVQFGVTNAQSFVVNSNTQITAVVSASNPSGASTIKVTKPSGNATSSFTVALNASPVVAAITGGSALCLPSTLALTDSTGGGVWSSSNTAVATIDGGGSVTGVASGTTTISYTVSNLGCNTASTQVVTVSAPVSITSSTASQTVVTGSTATFNVVATGSGLAYQWTVSTDGGSTYTTLSNDSNYSGTASASLVISNTPSTFNGYLYVCHVTGISPCSPADSNPAILNVGNTGVASDPADVSLCSTGTGTATFTVVGSGTVNSYSWEEDQGFGFVPLTNGTVTGVTYSGTNTATLSLSGLTTANSGFYYHAVVTGPANSATSNQALLTVNEGIVINTQPSSSNVCRTTTSALFSASASGFVVSTQWQQSANGTTAWSNISGATTSSYTVSVTPSTPVGTTYYRVVFTGSAACGNTTSNVASLTVVQPTITVTPSAATYCTPGSPVNLTASGASTYSWSPATGLSATTGSSVTASPSTTTTYTVTGTDAGGCVNTATVTISVAPAIVATPTATPTTVCTGGSSTLNAGTPVSSVTAAGYTFSASSGTYSPLTGGTNSTAIGDDGTQTSIAIGFPFSYAGNSFTTFGISTNGTIQLGTGATSFTNALASTLNVIAPLWDDNNRGTGSISYLTSGTAPNRVLTVDWSNIAIGGSGSSANSTNSFQLQLQENGAIKFVYGALTAANGISASIGLSGNTSGNFNSVTPLLPVNTSTTSTTVENSNIASVANLPSGTTYTFTPPFVQTYTYAWTPAAGLSNSTVKNPVASGITATTTYNVVITSSTGCNLTTSVTVTVVSDAVITTQPVAPAPICQGGSTTFTVVASGPGLTYQWRKDGVAITGATAATYTISGALPTASGSYDVVVTPSCGITATSNAVTLLVNPAPTATAPSAQSYCSGVATAPIALVGTPSGVTFDVSGGTSVGLSDQTAVTTIPSFVPTTGTATITITPKANGCTGTPVTYVITVNGTPSAITITPSSATVCSVGPPVSLTATGGTVSLSAYCASTHSSGCLGDNIAQVVLNTLNKITSTTCGTTSSAYSNFSGLTGSDTTTLTAGTAYTLSLTFGTDANQYFGAWIDYNQNGVFEAFEFLGASANAGSSGTIGVSFTPAGTVLNGLTRMRIVGGNDSAVTSTQACGASSSPYGETQDYDVTITGATNNAPSWSPIAGLYTDAAGTIAYTTGLKTSTVYAKPTASTTYAATATATSGCSTATNVTVTVIPATTWYADADGDGYGNPAVTQLACAQPVGYVAIGTDCDDTRANVNPGAVDVCYDGLDNDCNGVIDNVGQPGGCIPIVTVISPTQCGITLATIDAPVYANVVSGAQGYRFKVTNLSTGLVQSIDRFLRVFNITSLPVYAFATTYQVEVSVKIGGVWQPFFGTACTVSTPATTTKVQASQCGSSITSMNDVIYADLVPFAQGYRFRATNVVTSVQQVVNRSLRDFRMNLLTAPEYNATYTIEVAVKNTDGTYLPYGPSCNITTPSFPTTQLQASQCDYTASSNSEIIYADSFTNATVYRFKLFNTSLGYTYTLDRNTRTMSLDLFPGLTPSTTYSVQVSMKIDGVFGPYGKVCSVTTPGSARAIETGISSAVVAFKAIAYPNPFADNFKLEVKTSSDEVVTVRVYDMLGKLIENREIAISDIRTLEVGATYPTGVYNVIVNQGENTQTLRVIKR